MRSLSMLARRGLDGQRPVRLRRQQLWPPRSRNGEGVIGDESAVPVAAGGGSGPWSLLLNLWTVRCK